MFKTLRGAVGAEEKELNHSGRSYFGETMQLEGDLRSSGSIDIAGFDMSYTKALKETGMTHAGYNHSAIADKDYSVSGVAAFDDPQERRQIINDLRYLCTIANSRSIRINNLSYEANNLPQIIA